MRENHIPAAARHMHCYLLDPIAYGGGGYSGVGAGFNPYIGEPHMIGEIPVQPARKIAKPIITKVVLPPPVTIAKSPITVKPPTSPIAAPVIVRAIDAILPIVPTKKPPTPAPAVAPVLPQSVAASVVQSAVTAVTPVKLSTPVNIAGIQVDLVAFFAFAALVTYLVVRVKE